MKSSEHNYKDKKILVTGGLGFIGSNLAIRLVESGADVTIIDSMIPAYGGNLFNIEPIKHRVKLNFSDVRDQYSLAYLVRDQEIIFSLAGQLSHIDSMRDPMTDLEINCQAQLSLLECCRKENPRTKIVFSSTRQVYGKPQYFPVDERHPLQPIDVNGVNNLAAEMYYTLYHNVYGLRTVNLRLTNTYGQRMDLKSNVKGFVGVFLRQALTGETIQIYGDGSQRRDFNHVEDVINALLVAGVDQRVNGKSLNLAFPKAYNFLEFMAILNDVVPLKFKKVTFPEERKRIDIGDYYGSHQLFSDLTGWQPRIDLKEGLPATISFFQEFKQHYLP